MEMMSEDERDGRLKEEPGFLETWKRQQLAQAASKDEMTVERRQRLKVADIIYVCDRRSHVLSSHCLPRQLSSHHLASTCIPIINVSQ